MTGIDYGTTTLLSSYIGVEITHKLGKVPNYFIVTPTDPYVSPSSNSDIICAITDSVHTLYVNRNSIMQSFSHASKVVLTASTAKIMAYANVGSTDFGRFYATTYNWFVI